MVTEELKQVWNNVVVVAVVVAILEHWQRRFRPRYLEDCDLEFHNLEDTHPRLPFTLIFSYKKAHTQKKRESRQPRRKTEKKNNKKTEFKGEIEGCHTRKFS